MKKSDVKVGAVYTAKVSDKIAEVRIDAESRHGGWEATNLATGKKVRIKSAQRLRGEVKAKKASKPSRAEQDDGRCQVPRCRKPAAVTYLERRVCQDHWDVLSGDDQAAAEALRGKLGVNAESQPGEAEEAVAAPEGVPAKKQRAKKAAKELKPKRVSALDAAAQVLQAEGKPMQSQALIDAMAAQGLWSSPNGKTPAATLYAAILREINTKAGQARFKKVDRGQFVFNAGAQA